MPRSPTTPALGARHHFGTLEWSLTAGMALVWGSSFLWIAEALDGGFAPGLVPFLRVAFGTAALACIPSSRAPVARADAPRIALLGLLWMALPFLLYALAERTVSSAVTGMVNGGIPLTAALFAVVFTRTWPSLRRWLALGVGFAGIAVIAVPSLGDASADVPGVLMLLGAITCYGLATNLARPLQQRYGGPTLMLRVELAALVLTVPAAVLALPSSSFSWRALGAVAVLGALGTGIAFVMLAVLLGRTDAARATIGTFFTPIVAMVLGVVVRDEVLHPAAVVGAGIVILGAVLCTRPDPGRPMRDGPRAVSRRPTRPR